MGRYVALLQGVNVGGNKKVAMADLRLLLAGLGYTEVGTLLNSGNAVLTAGRGTPQALAADIERGLHTNLGLHVRCVVRSRADLAAVIDGHPLRDVATDGSKMFALFLSDPPAAERLAAADPRQLAPEHIRIGDGVIYQWCPAGLLASPDVRAYVEKRWKVAVTGRNWNTVGKLAALLDAK
ncbi:MAG: DUF1697 domain-containing protein [Frankiaceae bacterium]